MGLDKLMLSCAEISLRENCLLVAKFIVFRNSLFISRLKIYSHVLYCYVVDVNCYETSAMLKINVIIT